MAELEGVGNLIGTHKQNILELLFEYIENLVKKHSSPNFQFWR